MISAYFASGEIEVRRASTDDIDNIRNLQLSYDNQIEITKFAKMSYKEYLTWHVFNSLDSTYMLYIKGEFTAILGLGAENNLFFLTSSNLMNYKKWAVKYFKDILIHIMRLEWATKCKVFIDDDYKSSIKWAVSHDFKFKSLIELEEGVKFGIYEYTIQKDNLSL